MNKISPYYKAIVASVVATCTALGTALADGQITGVEWTVIVIALVTAAGITYGVPNIPNTEGELE